MESKSLASSSEIANGTSLKKRPLDDDRQVSLAAARGVIRRIVVEQYDRPSLVSEAACEIGAQIIEGVLQPEDELSSVELAARYKTSRTPIREALMLLEKERLVDIPPRRRARVANLDITEVREIYQTRASLLELIANDVVRKADDRQIDELSAIVDKMAAAAHENDIISYLWLNVGLYDLNTQIAGNRTIKRIIDSLLLRTLPLRRLSLSWPNGMHESSENHLFLVKAYRNRDANLAGAILRSNHISALARLESVYTIRERQAPRNQG